MRTASLGDVHLWKGLKRCLKKSKQAFPVLQSFSFVFYQRGRIVIFTVIWYTVTVSMLPCILYAPKLKMPLKGHGRRKIFMKWVLSLNALLPVIRWMINISPMFFWKLMLRYTFVSIWFVAAPCLNIYPVISFFLD